MMEEINREAKFDLHTHSFFSDGTDTPTEIADRAKEIGLSGFALTDHDTMSGWDEARKAAQKNKLEFLPGVELTTHEQDRSIHLLAYGLQEDDPRLLEEFLKLRESRLHRAKEMVLRLSRDFKIDDAKILAAAEGSAELSIGRPHLADALVNSGYFKDRAEAFEKALHPRGPYYVPTLQLATVRAIKLVEEAGGFPVLAHPAAFRMRKPFDNKLISFLASNGLRGIEVFHPENLRGELDRLLMLAGKLELTVTGSSDYHGSGKPNRLGERYSSEKTLELIRAEVATPR